MKKILALLMTFVLIMLGLAGCKKENGEETEKKEEPKTTVVDTFRSGTEKLAEFFAFGMPSADSFEDANKFGVNIRDIDLSIPNFPSDLKIPDISIGGTMTDDMTSIDMGLDLDGESIEFAGEIGKDGSIIVALPEATDYYISGNISELGELMGEGGDEALDAINEAFAQSGSMTELMNSKLSELLSEEYIKSEKTDVTVFGEEKVDIEKITLAVPSEKLKSIVADINKSLGSMGEAEVGSDDVSCDVSFFFDGESLIRAELDIKIGEKDSAFVYADMKTENGENKAELKFSALSEDKELFSFPATYSCKTADGKIEGEYSIKADFSAIVEAAGAETGEESGDGIGSSADMSQLAELGEVDISAKWEGTVSDSASDIEIDFSFGMKGITFTFPIRVKTEQTENTFKQTIGIDINIMTVKLAAEIETVLEKGASADGMKLDESKSIPLKALVEEDDSVKDKVEAMGKDVEAFIEKNQKLAELFESLSDAEDESAYEFLFSAYSDLVCFDFYAEGVGEYTERHTISSPTGDAKDLVLSFNGRERGNVTIGEDGTVNVFGEIWEGEVYSDPDYGTIIMAYNGDHTMYILIGIQQGIADIQYTFTYELDDSVVNIHLDSGEELSYSYVIDEAAGMISFDGVPLRYESADSMEQ